MELRSPSYRQGRMMVRCSTLDCLKICTLWHLTAVPVSQTWAEPGKRLTLTSPLACRHKQSTCRFDRDLAGFLTRLRLIRHLVHGQTLASSAMRGISLDACRARASGEALFVHWTLIHGRDAAQPRGFGGRCQSAADCLRRLSSVACHIPAQRVRSVNRRLAQLGVQLATVICHQKAT